MRKGSSFAVTPPRGGAEAAAALVGNAVQAAVRRAELSAAKVQRTKPVGRAKAAKVRKAIAAVAVARGSGGAARKPKVAAEAGGGGAAGLRTKWPWQSVAAGA